MTATTNPPTLLVPPAAEPVTVAEAKMAARLDGAHWDALVAGAITAAREVAEHETGRRFMAQQWRQELADWPGAGERLPFYAPTAVAVSYWNGATWLVLDPADYVWAPDHPGMLLAPALGQRWPALPEVALGARVRVDVTLGAASAAAVPAVAKRFMEALVSVMAADPSLTVMQALESSVYLPRMLDPLRLYR
jgi:uncharacterized phiE125 gp8 family phage protein